MEINNSFYRQPSESTFGQWKDQVPTDFLFAVKANRYITHLKKLNDVEESTKNFIDLSVHLERKLGPFLFQLPPSWKPNLARLSEFADALPKGYRYAFEFRNRDWYIPDVYEVLRRYNCAFCIYHLAGHQSPIEITADFAYVRLHGPGGKYQGKYSDAIMSEWADRCRTWKQAGKDVFFYFDNDERAYAIDNAKKLTTLLSRKFAKPETT